MPKDEMERSTQKADWLFLDREAASVVGDLPPDTEHALAIIDRAREILLFTDRGTKPSVAAPAD